MFESDRKTIAAVERRLQRITDLRHAYDHISLDDISEIVQRRVPSLCADCEAALDRLRSGQPL